MNTILLIIIGITVAMSFIAFNNIQIFEKYKFNISAISTRKEYIRLLSSGFLHSDTMHLLFNMMTLYFFGPIIIASFGEISFLIIYLGSILLGNLFTLYLYKNRGWYSAIGASGGVSGILFAAIAVYPQIGIYFFFIPIPIPGFIFGALYFSYSVYMMLYPRQNDNIGHAAHLGGAFFGLIFSVALLPQAAIENVLYLGIMALPLIYMGYMVFVKKKG